MNPFYTFRHDVDFSLVKPRFWLPISVKFYSLADGRVSLASINKTKIVQPKTNHLISFIQHLSNLNFYI